MSGTFHIAAASSSDEWLAERKRERIYIWIRDDSRFPKETGVDRTRRHCSVETIRGTGLSEPRWSRPMSKNPLERAWPRWDQRRLSNRREQILHFDLSRKGREAITLTSNEREYHANCSDTSQARCEPYVIGQSWCCRSVRDWTSCLLQLTKR